jgi:hypothetical protein
MKYPQYTLGLFTGFCLAALYFMVPAIFDNTKQPAEALEPKGDFTVVDEYKGCDVVKRENKSVFESQYFLHCNNTRPTYEK